MAYQVSKAHCAHNCPILEKFVSAKMKLYQIWCNLFNKPVSIEFQGARFTRLNNRIVG